MAHGDTTDDAAARLYELHAFFREHVVTGAEGHSYTAFGSRATVVAPGLPYNARVVEHIDRSVAEVVELTRECNPDAEPIPDRVAGVYAWARENMPNATQAQEQRRQALEFRHALEHAIAAGDTRVIRPLRCPACGTIGLHWRGTAATCINRHCARDNNGLHRTWTLAQLAYEHTAAKQGKKSSAG
jgi:hypothetical protein